MKHFLVGVLKGYRETPHLPGNSLLPDVSPLHQSLGSRASELFGELVKTVGSSAAPPPTSTKPETPEVQDWPQTRPGMGHLQ